MADPNIIAYRAGIGTYMYNGGLTGKPLYVKFIFKDRKNTDNSAN